MLSKLAQAGLGQRAAQLARSAQASQSPAFRAAPAIALANSPWIRNYAKNRPRPGKESGSQHHKSTNPSHSNSPSEPSTNSSPPNAAQPSQTSSQTSASAAQSTPNEQTSAEEKQATESAQEAEQIAFDKLPDLRGGIPSTFAQEMQEKAGGQQQSALQAIQQDEYGRGKREDGAEYMTTNERNRQWWTRFLLGSVGGGSVAAIAYMGRGWDDEAEAKMHPDIPNGWSPLLWWQRVRARMGESVSYYQDPAFEKLLPDPHSSFERPYTLCLSLEDLMVHTEWSRERGYRVAKRPGMDYFVRYLSQYYELVLFTSVPFAMGEPVVRKLDPFRFIMWPLYREATKFEEGQIVKDLSYLNRDLSKVIIIDTKASHVRKQPENAIVLDPWKGDPADKDLVGLIPFLEYIHTMQYSDVRKVLKSFDGHHIPTEFARREAIARKEYHKQLAGRKYSKPSGVGALGNMLGLNSNNMSMTMTEGEPNASEAFSQGLMLQDIARARGQRNYEMLEKEIRENGQKWLKEEADQMEKAQQEAMSSMMGSFSGWFVKGNKDGEAEKKQS